MGLLDLTAVELGKKIKAGEVSVVEATKAVLDQMPHTGHRSNQHIPERIQRHDQHDQHQNGIDDFKHPVGGRQIVLHHQMPSPSVSLRLT